MGLAERRAVEQFKQAKFPDLKKSIDQAAGFDVPVDVQWEKLAAEGYSHIYDDCFPKVYFNPLRDALKAIAVDQMGKDALKSGLKKVVISSTGEHISPSAGFTFDGGTLTLDIPSCSNVDNIEERTTTLQKLLESKL